jgi:transcription-repair coupling factor (superfamily II helicase)
MRKVFVLGIGFAYLCGPVMSNLLHLLEAYRKHPAVQKIGEQLGASDAPLRLHLQGMSGAQESFVLAATAQLALKRQPALRTHLLMAGSKEEAAYRHNDLEGLLGPDCVHFFPDSFKRPAFFDDLHPMQMLQRSEVVSKLLETGQTGLRVIVGYPEALFEKVVKPEVLQQTRIEVAKGERLDLDFLISVLVEYGFERADFVYEPGQFSIRGGIVDLFSYGNELPYRIELFDDEVETLRTFDPSTQLSKDRISRLSIVPNLNTRFRQDQKVSLWQILPADTLIWVKDFQLMVDRLQLCFERAEQFAAKLSSFDNTELREIFRDRAFLFPGDVLGDVLGRHLLFLEPQLKGLQKNFPDLFR